MFIHGFNENVMFVLLLPTANDGEKALGTVNQAATPAAVNELNNESIQDERNTRDRNEMDERKTLNDPNEKVKRGAFKGSENCAHTIKRNEKEERKRSFFSLEGICYYVSVPLLVQGSVINHLLPSTRLLFIILAGPCRLVLVHIKLV